MEFTREQKKDAFSKLPQQIKEFIFSEEFIAEVNLIAKNNGLLLDKAGLLEGEIFLVIYGFRRAADFVKNIEAKLAIDNVSASKIGAEVNKSVFLKIREGMQESEKPVENMVDTDQPNSENREDILAEIEHPSPTIHPISAADQTIAGPAISREVVTDLVAGKLSGMVTIPSQKIDASTNSLPPQKPKGYATDPYRESMI